ncbi:hypothetical protein DUF1284 [Gottschalkia acidurici 9a]|uniref:DUF1284 domain-containing protein n=1 Tax=Gottschalkia acidurici (strain ATCC 7906 / DSM 604 / BCRC 14475 / CIP 104303 / KCTC 5404 / NCIMB 10678 / 9a) TaxID=1128398 RepID=K0B2C2_GOTA9|nr:DUF1284 domain-containing protein [Gottschalkia acidurici]AFS78781.1 hypothetical protein DUF1284 [Gottschalkia acidurici 9a]
MDFILRGHHIFCIQGFRGKGYSEDFIHNMSRIIEYLKSDENVKVKIINSPDHICLGCPENIGQELTRKFESDKIYKDKGFCEKEQYVYELDNYVAKVLNIEIGKEYLYKDLLNRIKESLTEKKFDEICGSCQWYSLGYCKESLIPER